MAGGELGEQRCQIRDRQREPAMAAGGTEQVLRQRALAPGREHRRRQLGLGRRIA
jgi:hypothetical protein